MVFSLRVLEGAGVRGRTRLRPVIAAIVLILIFFAAPRPATGEVYHVDIPAAGGFPGAAAPAALSLACAGRADQLARYFDSRRLPFDPALVRKPGQARCHIYYEPTIRGFRAHPDSAPIQGLYFDVDHVGFLSQRATNVGDSLDIARAIVSHSPFPLSVNLNMPMVADRRWHESALRFHFPRTYESMWLRESQVRQSHAWTQDYMKSGQVSGVQRLLAPRRIFEGRAEYGARYRPILDSLSQKIWAHSRLSWEGGDLQFLLDPRDSRRLLLLHGNAARPYWGQNLTDKEYSHVLKIEFGADEAVDLGGVTAHVDYFVSFLPASRIALVAQPLQNDFEVSRQALNLLLLTFWSPVPPVLRELDQVYATRESAFGGGAERARGLLARARREYPAWSVPVDADVYQRLQAHAREHCPDAPEECLSLKRLPSLLERDMALVRYWWHAATVMRIAERLPPAMLSVLESQLPGAGADLRAASDAKARLLEQLGLQVIRVPLIGGDPHAAAPWGGISYANSALIGDTLFVPAFGLGAVEQRILDELQARLPARYRVVPVLARHAILQNGGVHCVIGFLREASPEAPPS